MADIVNLNQDTGSVDVSPLFDSYSTVNVLTSDNKAVSAGGGAGRTLEVDNPLFGSAEVAQKMLNRLYGYQHQPYKSDGAILDPAAEIGDAVSVQNVYGGIFTRKRNFGRLMRADISAPVSEEINHEYKFESPTERKFTRQVGEVRASLVVQSDLIQAKVSKKSPEGQTSFSWELDDTSHTWYADGDQVMKVSASGLEVKGKITAKEGYIGDGSTGFTIKSSYIYNGMTELDDTDHNGIYIGTTGIALGKGNFKVDSSGNVTAKSISLYGSLKMYNANGTSYTEVTAKTLADRANSAYTSTSKGGYCYSGATAGNSAQATWKKATTSTQGIDNFYANNIEIGFNLSLGRNGSITYQGYPVGLYTVVDSQGNTHNCFGIS